MSGVLARARAPLSCAVTMHGDRLEAATFTVSRQPPSTISQFHREITLRSSAELTYGKFASSASIGCGFAGMDETRTTSRLATFTRERGMKQTTTKIAPPHPGDVLREDFLKPMGITPNALAIAIRVPASRIAAISKGHRSVSAETAIRLARYFGTTREFWMNLQSYYDLAIAEDQQAAMIEREVLPANRCVSVVSPWFRGPHFRRCLRRRPAS